MDSTHEEVKHKKSIVGSEENSHIGYGLRENPKKSWKISGFKEDITSSAAASSMEQNQCKVCGKEFESLKALYGHMRHHSGGKRRRIQCKECEKWFLSLKSLSNHMGVHAQKLRFHNDHQSETTSSSSRQDLVVESLYAKKKRSKRIKRYRSINASSSISSLNEPLLSFNETDDDQEVEHVAVCLMMLSKGVHDWGEFHSFNEFSDDDDDPAVSFEVKSLIQKKRTLRNDDESSEINKPRDACASDSLTDLNEQIEKNDDQLEVCTEKLHKGSEFGMPKLDIESGFVSYGIEIEKEIEVELGINFDACDSEIGVDSCNKVKFSTPESEMVDDSVKKVRIMCKTCNKMFYSHQALGGHQKKQGVRKGCKAQKTKADYKLVKLECIENLMEGKASGTVVKDHQCPICFKVFIKGQALGGHKRAHFLKNSETRPQEVAMSQDHPTISEDFDINIPIMIDQQDNGDTGFKQWWNDSNRKPEPLVAN